MKWSYSAHRSMRQCARQVVFGQVVAHHSGTKHPERREAYLLKQLQSRSAWQGSVVHRVLATALVDGLRQRRAIDWAGLTVTAHSLAQRQFEFSAARRYRARGLSKSRVGPEFCALAEHEPDRCMPLDALERAQAIIATCLSNLESQTEFVAALRAGRDYIVEQSLRFRIAGIRIPLTATPDLIYRRSTGRLTVVDWKIGESGTAEYSRQLLTYAVALWRCGRWPQYDLEGLELIEANLLKNEVRVHPLTAARLRETESFIFRSTSELDALLGGVGYTGLGMLTEYDVAARPGTCALCNYRPMCVGCHQAQVMVDGPIELQGVLL